MSRAECRRSASRPMNTKVEAHLMRPQPCFRLQWIVALLIAISFVAPASAATPEEVQKAIDHAKKFLLSKQKKNGTLAGTWEEVAAPVANGGEGQVSTSGRQWGGLTS